MARGAFVLRSLLSPPWALRIEDRAPLTLVVMVRGHAHVLADDGTRAELDSGAVAVLRGPGAYTVADDPRTAPQAVIHPGQRCTRPDGTPLTELSELGVRSWGNDAGGEDVMVTGTYQLRSETSRRLLAALPPLLVQPAGTISESLVAWLAEEVALDRPGQEAALDRLLDLLLVAALRARFAATEEGSPGWYRAHTDAVIGPALRAMQHQPQHPWTVASLAATAGISRAGLARRFTDVVGEPPMTFLTHWRLALAADLMLEPGSSLTSVARDVGYGSPYSLSAAFTRVRGVSPSVHRERGREGRADVATVTAD